MNPVIGPHRAKLVAEGKKLKCALCGVTVMRFLDPPKPANTRSGHRD